MGSTVLTAPASRKAQGRSASGRNGGARKTTSSNSVVMRIALNDFVFAYVQAVLSNRYFMTIRAVLQLFACGPVLFPLDWAARSQLGKRSFCDTRPRLWPLHVYIPFTVGQSHVLV